MLAIESHRDSATVIGRDGCEVLFQSSSICNNHFCPALFSGKRSADC